MARRRMFSLDIVDTDKFACMSKDARYLYYELGVRADDDGFIGSPMRIIKMTESTIEDLDELIDNGFIIRFNTGIVVIKDWLQNNQIRNDRYKPTVYAEERQQISIDKSTKKYILTGNGNQAETNGLPDDNQAETNGLPDDNQAETNGLPDKSNDIEKESENKDFGIPNGNQRFPQDRLGKDRIDKNRTGEYLAMFKNNVGSDRPHLYTDFDNICKMYNEICKSFKPITNIEAYTENHSKVFTDCAMKGYQEEDYRIAFNKAENDDYLKGQVEGKTEPSELSWMLERLDRIIGDGYRKY